MLIILMPIKIVVKDDMKRPKRIFENDIMKSNSENVIVIGVWAFLMLDHWATNILS